MNEILYPNLEAIAKRLNVGKKTVLVWYKQEGLPAFRANDRSNAPLMCLESQLCVWLQKYAERRIEKAVNRQSDVFLNP